MQLHKRKMNKRSQLIGAILVLLFFALVYRFYHLQVVDASFYYEEAERMYNRYSVLPAERGAIYDRNGATLAKEAKAYTVVAILSEKAQSRVENAYETAQALAPILEMPVDTLYQSLSREGPYQVELRPGGWKIDADKKSQIDELKLPGITFIEESKRYYPNHNFASHVLGFLNRDGDPVMGLEAHLNELLKGEDGFIQFKRDVQNRRLPQGTEAFEAPEHGHELYLTLDERIQMYVERALDDVEAEYRPEKMTAIVSNPKTGEILAMSSRPAFDPNDYSTITNYVNHAVSSVFEPGSTFKIITLAAAIEEGIYRDDETYMSGNYRVPGGTINDHNQYGWGQITFLEGVQKSSNVAFTILGWERMSRRVFYDYIYRFGFGDRTGIDLPGEHGGMVRSADVARELDVATMTFGQGVAVTAIQQVAAINAIANGGKLMKPYIIDKIVDPNTGDVIQENTPTVVREQVVSEATAKKVRDILETVVTDGTGTNFYIEGYQVAGKTGTAQKVGPSGGYVDGKYIYSFIGFAPKDDPELVVYVVIDEPDVPHYFYGGSVVAQAFKPIMLNSLQYLSVMPTFEEVDIQEYEQEGFKLDSFEQTSVMAARQKAEVDGLHVIVLGNGATVMEQLPQAGTTVTEGDFLYLITSEFEQATVPDMTNWSLKSVLDWANLVGVTVRRNGHGYVQEQFPEAGEVIRRGGQLNIQLKAPFDHVE
jgi:penicillin-binding protein 2B